MLWAAMSSSPSKASRAGERWIICELPSIAQTAPPTNPPLAFCESSAPKFTWSTTPRMAPTSTRTAAAPTRPRFRRLSRSRRLILGITHDGDADRVLLCDENGELVDGDEIMAIAALDFLKKGRLTGNTLVATVMSNFGLDEALAAEGGRVLRTKVGDRYVIETMMRDGLNVGGEQSGHMIFRDYATTGDGIVSALQILRIMIETGKPLSELKKVLKKYPQAQRNLKVREKPALETLGRCAEVCSKRPSKGSMARGRVLLRYSGTEPKIRLLIEGRDETLINGHADRIAGAIQDLIGAS